MCATNARCDIHNLRIPKNVRTIASSAFSVNHNMEKLTVDSRNTTYRSSNNCCISGNTVIFGGKNPIIPSEITTIGVDAFLGKNVETLNLPEGITEIGGSAFQGSCFSSLNIPNSVTSIGISAFTGNPNLETVKLGSGITLIPNSMFESCPKLKNLTWNGNITSIGRYSFSGNAFTELTIPEGVVSIDMNAFEKCSELKAITFPSTLETIGNRILTQSSVIRINCYMTTAPSIESFGTIPSGGTLHIPRTVDVSVYAEWMKNEEGKLGKYGWTIINDL